MRFILLIITTLILASGCKDHIQKEIVKLDKHWIDSVIQKSDTSWIKPYRNNTFVTAEYYVDKKDSIVTQVMKDAAGTIRQINIAKYDRFRLFFAEYYANGQLVAALPLDPNGRYHGLSKSYYETGILKNRGNYIHSFHSGEWQNFDEKGKLVSVETYDQNGQLISTVKK